MFIVPALNQDCMQKAVLLWFRFEYCLKEWCVSLFTVCLPTSNSCCNAKQVLLFSSAPLPNIGRMLIASRVCFWRWVGSVQHSFSGSQYHFLCVCGTGGGLAEIVFLVPHQQTSLTDNGSNFSGINSTCETRDSKNTPSLHGCCEPNHRPQKKLFEKHISFLIPRWDSSFKKENILVLFIPQSGDSIRSLFCM